MKNHPFTELERAVSLDRATPRRAASWPLMLLAVLTVFFRPTLPVSLAATPGSVPSAGKYGAVNVLASAPVRILPCFNGQNAVALFNNGPNTIWCGFDSAVATTSGFPVLSSGFVAIDITSGCVDSSPGLFCIASTADQVAPANTRFMAVR